MPRATTEGPRVPEATPAPTTTTRRGIDTRGRTLRGHAARGVLINAGFDAGLSLLGLVRGFLLAALLTRAAYGVWGVLTVSLGLLASLKVVGIGDRYLQQDEPDQELAFQRAFTLEVLMTAGILVLLVAAVPVIALVYGNASLLAPGLVLATVLAADALQAPLWILYRRMDFRRQRSLGLVEPVVGFVVAIVLAAAGLGYWAPAIGVAAGAWAGAAVAVGSCPYRLRWRYDGGTLRLYAGYSAPILVASLAGIVLANATTIATHAHLGMAGVGAVALAANVTAFTSRVDALVGGTIYPAICAIQDRLDLLHESFVKSNRLAVMWAMPAGVGLALFAPDLVRFGIGERWRPAIVLLQITGVTAAVSQIGFNWDDYLRARARTVPLAVAGVVSAIVLLGVGLPMLFAHGLDGLAVGIAAGAAADLAVRGWFLSQMFRGWSFARHALRAVLPTVPAAAAVLAARALEPAGRSLVGAVVELGGYAAIAAVATWIVEGALVREAVGYLRGS